MQKRQKSETLFPRLAEYASQNQNQRRVVENAVALTDRMKDERGDAFVLALADPAPTADGIVRWTVVEPSYPAFHEAISARIRQGYLPLGVLDVTTATATIFSDVVPEPIRSEYVEFAGVQARIIYQTLTGKMLPQDSWLENRVLVALESAEKNAD